MKILFLSILLSSAQAFATGGFECKTEASNITVSGTVGAGMTLLRDVYISHISFERVVPLKLSMNWINYSNEEIRAISYDAMIDIQRLSLKVNEGKGFLKLDLSGITGAKHLVLLQDNVLCEFE